MYVSSGHSVEQAKGRIETAEIKCEKLLVTPYEMK
jgi:hypothetical protein